MLACARFPKQRDVLPVMLSTSFAGIWMSLMRQPGAWRAALTDVEIDWGGMTVSDTWPSRVPDLFVYFVQSAVFSRVMFAKILSFVIRVRSWASAWEAMSISRSESDMPSFSRSARNLP